MKLVNTGLLVAFCILLLSSTTTRAPLSNYTTTTVATFTKDAQGFTRSLNALKDALSALSSKDQSSIKAARNALKCCRIRYKRIEFFMEYFFEYPVNLYNRAPVYEIEEPYAEYQSPIGLQVIEGLLMEDDPFLEKKELLDQCEVLVATASDIPAQLYQFSASDPQVLESIRLELVRVITLGITGYDAPRLKTGIPEAAEALRTLKKNLEIILKEKQTAYNDSINSYLDKCITLLDAHPEFDRFDRLTFLTTAALPLQQQFGLFIKEQDLDLNTHEALDHQAAHLFSRNAINLNAFCKSAHGADNGSLAALGKELFSEQALSGNGRRSCATCHQPGKAFTDGLIKSKALDEKGDVVRNAPTLYYAAYQRSQFYDGRAASLEEQIKFVLQNKREMDGDLDSIAAWLNKNNHYRPLFEAAFHLPQGTAITVDHTAGALAAYEQTLAPFNSPFDRYIGGDALALSADQKTGFNLFMGKAQCGTCHFAPVFNGLLPPYYERSESEVLGVPQNASRRHPRLDTDSGRYGFFAISFNNGAFKTSTVRNASLTGPYMHNGVFKTLDQVIDFYNRGGGKGIKLAVDNQTLSDKPLELTAKEKKSLIAFLQALSDQPTR